MAKDKKKKKGNLSEAFNQAAKGVAKSAASNKSLPSKVRNQAKRDVQTLNRRIASARRNNGGGGSSQSMTNRTQGGSYSIQNSRLRRNNPQQNNKRRDTQPIASRLKDAGERVSSARTEGRGTKGTGILTRQPEQKKSVLNDRLSQAARNRLRGETVGAKGSSSKILEQIKKDNQIKEPAAQTYGEFQERNKDKTVLDTAPGRGVRRGLIMAKSTAEDTGANLLGLASSISTDDDRRYSAKEGVYQDIQGNRKTELYEQAERLKGKARENEEEAKKGLGRKGQFALDVEGAVLGMAGDAAVGAATGSGPVGSLGSMFARSYGGGYLQAKEEGASDDQAMLYGAATGAIETGTEKMFSVGKAFNRTFGAGWGDDIIQQAAAKGANKLASRAAKEGTKNLIRHGTNYLTSALTEGLEEVAADIADPFVANAIYATATGNPHKISAAETGRDFLIGAVLGGLGGGVSEVSSYKGGTAIKNKLGKNGLKEMADFVSNADESAGVSTHAKAISQMVQNGEDISNAQVVQIYNEAVKQEQRNFKRHRTAVDAVNKKIRSENLVQPIGLREGPDGNLMPTIGANTNANYQWAVAEAQEELGKLSVKDPSESEVIAMSIANVRTGIGYTDDIEKIISSPEARAVYESTTGDNLPETREAMREHLETKMAENRYQSAVDETAYFRSEQIGLLMQTETADLGGQGQAVFESALNETLENGSDLADDMLTATRTTFDDYYKAGQLGMPFATIQTIEKPEYDKVSDDIKRRAYDAGIADNSINMLLDGEGIRRGEDIDKAVERARAEGKAAPGGLTISVDDELRKYVTAQDQKMYRNMGQTFGVGIHLMDAAHFRQEMVDRGLDTSENDAELPNGFYSKGEIFVNIETPDRGVKYVVAHEFTHHLQQVAPEEYLQLRNLLVQKLIDNGEGDLAKILNNKSRQYGDLNSNDMLDEIIADSTYEFLQDKEFINDCINSSPSLCQRLWQALKEAIRKLRMVLQNESDYTPSQNADLWQTLDALTEAEQLWYDAIQVAGERALGTDVIREEGGIQFSQKDEAYLDAAQTMVGLSSERIDSLIKEYATDSETSDYAQAYITTINPRDYLKLTISDDALNEWTQGSTNAWGQEVRDLDAEELKESDRMPYLRISSMGEDGNRVIGHEGRHRMLALLRAGYTDVPVVLIDNDTKNSKVREDSIDLWSQDHGDGPVNGDISIDVYDAIPIRKNMRDEIDNMYGVTEGVNDRVQFSIKVDSEGNSLTPQQRAYFKNTKAVDENGNLLKLYHGTSQGPRISEFSNSEDGYWFTPDTEARDNYSQGYEFGEIGTLQGRERNPYDSDEEYFEKMGFSFEQDEDGEWYARRIDERTDEVHTYGWTAETKEELMDRLYEEAEDETSFDSPFSLRNYYPVYLNLENPKIVECNESDHDDINGTGKTTREMAAEAKEEGYDGIIFKDVVDPFEPIDVYVAFDSNQIKDVRNDNPTDSSDIRYSLPELETEKITSVYDLPEGDVADRISNIEVRDVNTDKVIASGDDFMTVANEVAQKLYDDGFDDFVVTDVLNNNNYGNSWELYNELGDYDYVYAMDYVPERMKLRNRQTEDSAQEENRPSTSRVDAEGNELTNAQVDFFKDSKVRDENGNLMVMYHGTMVYGFTVFDKAKAHLGGNSGAGFYFSNNRYDSLDNYQDKEGADNYFKRSALAEQIMNSGEWNDEQIEDYDRAYEIATEELNKNPGLYEVYLNITNPYVRDYRNTTDLYEAIMEDFDESVIDRDDYEDEDDYQNDLSEYRAEHMYEQLDNAVRTAIDNIESVRGEEVSTYGSYDDIVNQMMNHVLDYDRLDWDDVATALVDYNVGVYDEAADSYVDATHEVTRGIVEYFGFDGIIDKEVSKKFNQVKNMTEHSLKHMDAEDTQHVIAFHENQIKLITNENPTSDQDIRFSQKAKDELEDIGVHVTDSGSVTKFSLKSWAATDKKKLINALRKAGFERSEIDAWINDLDSVARMIAEDKVRLDYEAADNQTMLKDNLEYIKTLDASTLCAKRILYQGTYNAIAHAMPDTPLLVDDVVRIRQMLDEHGLESPCGICYVESRRKTLGKYSKEWLDNYKGDYIPKLADVTTTDGLEKLRKEHPDVYESYTKAMRKKGVQNPKVVELRTDYRGEIFKIQKNTIEKLKRIGGLRVQSFSDFETPHLIDMMQAIMDMAAKNLTAQAYTKVPNFAWAFGDTGIKINLSLIAKKDADGNLVYDEDGRLEFDSKEGMPLEEALKLRERYPDNVGTIVVGINEEHILAAMADDRIDMIIPFHRSGWGQAEYEGLGLTGYDDFSSEQVEYLIHPYETGKIKKNGKPEIQNTPPEGDYYSIDYWDYSKTGKENAETYLKMCAESERYPVFKSFLHDNGDGSFSLMEDGSTDGYWKMLIDFKMYDNDGKGAPQKEVQPNFNMEECRRILEDYEGGANSLPVADEVVTEFLDEYRKKHPDAKFSRKDVSSFERERADARLYEEETAKGYFEKQYDLYSLYQNGTANRDNFMNNTMAVFDKVSRRPKDEPDYTSHTRDGKVSSEYWYTDDGVIRGSDHWGVGIASCDWALKDKNGKVIYGDRYGEISKTSKLYGKADWNDFVYKTSVASLDGEKVLRSFDNSPERDLIEHNDTTYRYNRLDYSWNDVRFSQREIADEDTIYEYMSAHPEEYSDMLYDEEWSRDYKQHKDETIEGLRNQVQKLKQNQKLTHGKVLDTKSVRQPMTTLVKNLLQSSEEGRGIRKTDNQMVKDCLDNARTMYRQYKNGDTESMILTAFNTAENMVSKLQFVNDDSYQHYKDLRDHLKNRTIRVSDTIRSDIPDYKDFRKSMFGRLRLSNDKGVPVDQEYAELCELYPELFNSEISNPTDQLVAISDVLESMRPYEVFLSSEEANQLINQTATDLIDITIRGEAYRSMADRYKERLQAAEQRYKEETRKQRERQQEQRQRYKKREEDLKRKHREQKQKKKSARERAKNMTRLQKDYKWLTDRLVKPTDEKHIPEEFRQALAEFLMQLDLQTERSKKLERKYGKVSYKTEKMYDLRSKLSEIAKEDGSGVFEYDGYVFELMDAFIEKLRGVHDNDLVRAIDELSDAELQDVQTILRSIRHSIDNVNKTFTEGLAENIEDLAVSSLRASQDRIQKFGRYKERQNFTKGISALLNESMVTPRDFFERLGGGMKDVFMAIRHGQDKHIQNVQVFRNFMADVFEGYGRKGKPGSKIEKWRGTKSVKSYSLEHGGTIELSTAQAMSLYCAMKREQAAGHILGGGIVPTEVVDEGVKTFLIGKRKAIQTGTARVTYNDVQKIISDLNDEQIRIADRLMEFLNTTCAEWGNETSMALYGYNKFREENYFPIKSSDMYLDTNFDGRDLEERIKNFGFTKGTVTSANNPIVIDDIFSVVADHANKMSMYNAFAAPISDFTRVYNYKMPDPEAEDDIKTIAVKEAVAAAHGKRAQKYIRDFMADVQNQENPRNDPLNTAFNKLLANYKKATIGGNIRVALQQPTAIMRAFTLINPRYFVGLSTVNVRSNMKEMKEHCPIALWKSWGFNQIDLANTMEDIMMNKEWSREDLLFMEMYGALDNATWSIIWGAVKNEVEHKHPELEKGSAEYWDACNERASEIFDKTQVVDSVLHRSAVMRNKDTMTKILVSFLAEPTRTFNMMRSGYADALELWKSGDKMKAAGKFAHYTNVFLANALVCGAAAAIADALRGKDLDGDGDDDTYIELVLNNFFDNANPLMMLPLMKDVWGFYENADKPWMSGTSNMGLEGISSLMEAAHDISEDGLTPKTLKAFAEGIGLVTGKPVKNVLREMDSLFGIDIFAATSGDESGGGSETEESMFDKLLSNIPFIGGKNDNGDGSGSGSSSAKEEAEYETGRMTKALRYVGITDGSTVDKFLNKHGYNLTAQEKQQQAELEAREEYVQKVKQAAAETPDNEKMRKDGKLWKVATKGYTKAAETGDIETLEYMRKTLEQNGGNVEEFDKAVESSMKSGIKKTLSTDGDYETRNKLKDYLKEHYGWTDERISDEILKKSDTAKEFQKALVEGDKDKELDAYFTLAFAGVTDDTIQELYQKRWTQSEAQTTGTFSWPVQGGRISSHYGGRWGRLHAGTDIAVPVGTPVSAADGGTVMHIGRDSSRGIYVDVKHENGYITRYQHLSGYSVQKGQRVAKGEEIAKSGNTGFSTGPHLHFSVYKGGTSHADSLDPEKFLSKR